MPEPSAGTTKSEAAASLRCSEKKVDRLVKIGVLDTQHVGRNVYITRESIVHNLFSRGSIWRPCAKASEGPGSQSPRHSVGRGALSSRTNQAIHPGRRMSRWIAGVAWFGYGCATGLIAALLIPAMGVHLKGEVDLIEVAKVVVGASAALYVSHVLQRRGVVKEAVSAEIRACLEKIASLEEHIQEPSAKRGAEFKRDVKNLGMRLKVIERMCAHANVKSDSCKQFDGLQYRLMLAIDGEPPVKERPEFVLGEIRVAVLASLVDTSGTG